MFISLRNIKNISCIENIDQNLNSRQASDADKTKAHPLLIIRNEKFYATWWC